MQLGSGVAFSAASSGNDVVSIMKGTLPKHVYETRVSTLNRAQLRDKQSSVDASLLAVTGGAVQYLKG